MSRSERAIETVRQGAYLRPVLFARLIRFLTILALGLAPLATGAAMAPAMAHHEMMTADGPQVTGHEMAGHEIISDHDATVEASMAGMPHCNDMDGKSKDEPCRSGDCMVACAAVPAVATAAGEIEPHALPHGLLQQPALVLVPHSLVPEAATPPPRGLLEI